MNIKNLNIKRLTLSLHHNQVLQQDYYEELKQSIKTRGLLVPLIVNELDNGLYSILDGHYRFIAMKELGYEFIPCNVLKLKPEQVTEMHIVASAHHIKTSQEDYKRNLRRIIYANPLLTLPELAYKINKSNEWLLEQLELTDMQSKALNKIKDGSIKLSNALALSELPKDMQGDYIEQAINLKPTDFGPIVSNKKYELGLCFSIE